MRDILTKMHNSLTKMRDSLTKMRDSLTKMRDSLTKMRDSLTKMRDILALFSQTYLVTLFPFPLEISGPSFYRFCIPRILRSYMFRYWRLPDGFFSNNKSKLGQNFEGLLMEKGWCIFRPF
jgi:hypothetical protein